MNDEKTTEELVAKYQQGLLTLLIDLEKALSDTQELLALTQPKGQEN